MSKRPRDWHLTSPRAVPLDSPREADNCAFLEDPWRVCLPVGREKESALTQTRHPSQHPLPATIPGTSLLCLRGREAGTLFQQVPAAGPHPTILPPPCPEASDSVGAPRHLLPERAPSPREGALGGAPRRSRAFSGRGGALPGPARPPRPLPALTWRRCCSSVPASSRRPWRTIRSSSWTMPTRRW